MIIKSAHHLSPLASLRTFIFVITTFFFVIAFTAISHAVTLGWPTPGTDTSSGFGPRNLNGNPPGASRVHRGVDIRGSTPGVNGDPITAAHSGTVIRAVNSNAVGSGYGNMVQIQYADGSISTVYGHLNTVNVRVGDTVAAGQQIGTMGGARGTRGAGTSSGTHLHYEVRVTDANGQEHWIDPMLAQGQDLSDPAVVADLIEESQARLAGASSEVTPGLAAATAAGGGSGPASCSQDILDTGKQLKEANMNIDKGIIDQMIQPPQSVMELSCFDQFGEMFNQEIGAIFSDTTQGLEAFNFGGIFQDAQASIMSEMSGLIFGDRAANFGSQISSALGDAFSGIFGSNNVDYGCEVMQVMWEIMQCENILDFDIPSLKDLMGGAGGGGSFMDSLKPDSCTGQALFDGAMQAADRAFSDFGGNLPQQLQPSNIENLIRSY